MLLVQRPGGFACAARRVRPLIPLALGHPQPTAGANTMPTLADDPAPGARISKWWLPGLFVVTALAYWPGLHGPFLFDDPPNLLTPLGEWLRGETTWPEVVFGNASGMFGRSLSMLSFLATAAIGGLDPFWFKLTNLALHLSCGALVHALCSRLLLLDARTAQRHQMLAGFVAALWLLHPIQVSTVLYAVQRMAQLSALFVLVALWLYVVARRHLQAGRTRRGVVILFALVPIATLAAVLGKENGALVPILCAVIEWGYFPAPLRSRPAAIKVFFLVFLVIPLILGMTWFTLHPDLVLSGYATRTFTLGDRLLSEPRALVAYLTILLLPRGPRLGLYTDDFPVSHGLLDPPGTLLALLTVIALLVAAFAARRRLPGVATGILFYFAAQSMESGVFPLELYFEHRNYLPSVGLFLALVALGHHLVAWSLSVSNNPRRLRLPLTLAGTSLLALLALSTAARAYTWRSFDALAWQGAMQHPQSLRAQMDYANSLQKQGRVDEVQAVFDHVATIANPAAAHVAAIDTVALQCMTRAEATPAAIERMRAIAGAPLQAFEMLAWSNLADYLEKHDCRNLDKAELAQIIVSTVDAAPQPARLVQLWRSRFIAAKLYMQAGAPLQAQAQLAIAWSSGAADPAVGIFFAHVCLVNGDKNIARLVVSELRERMHWWDTRGARFADEIDRAAAK